MDVWLDKKLLQTKNPCMEHFGFFSNPEKTKLEKKQKGKTLTPHYPLRTMPKAHKLPI
jgi:hypothetical protein